MTRARLEATSAKLMNQLRSTRIGMPEARPRTIMYAGSAATHLPRRPVEPGPGRRFRERFDEDAKGLSARVAPARRLRPGPPAPVVARLAARRTFVLPDARSVRCGPHRPRQSCGVPAQRWGDLSRSDRVDPARAHADNLRPGLIPAR